MAVNALDAIISKQRNLHCPLSFDFTITFKIKCMPCHSDAIKIQIKRSSVSICCQHSKLIAKILYLHDLLFIIINYYYYHCIVMWRYPHLANVQLSWSNNDYTYVFWMLIIMVSLESSSCSTWIHMENEFMNFQMFSEM